MACLESRCVASLLHSHPVHEPGPAHGGWTCHFAHVRHVRNHVVSLPCCAPARVTSRGRHMGDGRTTSPMSGVRGGRPAAVVQAGIPAGAAHTTASPSPLCIYLVRTLPCVAATLPVGPGDPLLKTAVKDGADDAETRLGAYGESRLQGVVRSAGGASPSRAHIAFRCNGQARHPLDAIHSIFGARGGDSRGHGR